MLGVNLIHGAFFRRGDPSKLIASLMDDLSLTLDLLQRALEQFLEDPSVRGQKPVVLAEMTLRSLAPAPDAGHDDFLPQRIS